MAAPWGSTPNRAPGPSSRLHCRHTAKGSTMKTATAREQIKDRRVKAVWRLFDTKFHADYRISVGSATCENAAGSQAVYEKLTALAAAPADKRVTIGTVGCTGRCDMEPVVTVVGRSSVPVKYVNVTPEKAQRIFESHVLHDTVLEDYSMRHREGGDGVRRSVTITAGENGDRERMAAVASAFARAVAEHGLAESVTVAQGEYSGEYADGPAAYVYPDNIIYEKLDDDSIERIVVRHLRDGKPVDGCGRRNARISNRFVPLFGDVHFFGKQLRMTLRNCGVIDPESIEEYLAVKGYEAAARMLDTMSPAAVIDAVKRSGLRGRGGGGFPAATKWELAQKHTGGEKYLICNADEGDPGAFMDRSTIEGDPHTVVEGMIIAGYAMGATRGFVYTRVEYPLAIERLEKAIADAREYGFLGTNVFGSGWDFDIEVRLGAGAFVCGEETALIRSIEGYRGEPKQKPPFPTDEGLWGRPTVINNVETLANLPVILLDTPEWFSSVGTSKSKGTKVFALAGKVRHTGLIEVPMGTTLREVIYDVGGGIPDGREFKAVQTGGPAGGCLPAEYLDTPVDYDSLTAAGSIMGSGGMIVMDDTSCMVDVARFFLGFMVDESCGQCTPCRAGTTIMKNILDKIANGKATMGDLRKLEELAATVGKTSLCGLGKASPNPVLSTLRYFRDEYVEHIESKKCRAGVCTGLLSYRIDTEKCVGCGACKRKCPAICILGSRRQPHEIIEELCIKCGTCQQVCRFGAVYTA
ncbi:MAG: NADH-quinone oxidoreductase subunit F [Chitinivibrionales bacterium]|nr:NADH-quinone oxidoreductase subunit F [Chitinivibrionales bacterium]